MTFNEMFPIVPLNQKNGSMYRLLPWCHNYLYSKYEDRLKAMGSLWSLAFANFVASQMELIPIEIKQR